MPDYSLCFGRDCEARNKCFRYRAAPNKLRQTYAAFDTVKHGLDRCPDFMPLGNRGYDLLEEDHSDRVD